MHVPERFKTVGVADLLADTILREVTLAYLKDFWTQFDRGVAPVFFGRAGTGKTTAAAVIARYVWEVGQVDTAFITVPDIVTQVDFSRFEPATQAVLWRMKTVPFLILDDAHVISGPNTPVGHAMTSVISVRWNERRPTLWTGNFDLAPGREWSGLYAQFGPILGRRLEDGSEGYRVLAQ